MNTVNHETYVSLEVAGLLKKAGFDWEVNHSYPNTDALDNSCSGYIEDLPFYHNLNDGKYGGISAPTLAIAQKWLREVKDKQVHVISYRDQKTGKLQGWCYKVYEMSQGWEFNYPTYEKALEAGIKKCLEEDSITDKCSEE